MWTHLAVHTGCRSLGWCRFVPSVRWMPARPGSRRTRRRSARRAATAGWCWWRATCPPSTSTTRWFSWAPPRVSLWPCTADTQRYVEVKTKISYRVLFKSHRSLELNCVQGFFFIKDLSVKQHMEALRGKWEKNNLVVCFLSLIWIVFAPVFTT